MAACPIDQLTTTALSKRDRTIGTGVRNLSHVNSLWAARAAAFSVFFDLDRRIKVRRSHPGPMARIVFRPVCPFSKPGVPARLSVL